MKPSSLFCIFCVVVSHLLAQNPTFQWAKAMGSGGDDEGKGITSDGAGDVITVGDFFGTVDFDPGTGISNLVSTSGSADIFIQKLDAAGNFVWAKRVGGSNGDRSMGVVVDGSNNIYLIGYYQGTVDFDPGAPIFNLTSNSNSFDLFIEKLDPSGNLIWAKSIGGAGDDVGFSIALDNSNNVLYTGKFSSTVDFDPNAGISNLAANGGTDICIGKLDLNGSFLWAKALGGSSDDVGWAITVDANGNVYSTGIFDGVIDLDPGAGTAISGATGNNIFVSKLNSSGNFILGKSILSNSSIGRTIAVDGSGNMYVGGSLGFATDFDPGAGSFVLSPNGGYDAFVWKLNSIGNFGFAMRHGGSGNDYVNSIQLDALGNIYHSGFFMGTSDFDPSGATYSLTSTGLNPDCYISKLDTYGNFQWAVAFNGSGDDGVNSLRLESNGSLYSTGYFSSTVDFDPGAGIANLTGAENVFVHKLSLPCVSPSVPTLSASPNTICTGGSTTLNIVSGSLNGATQWQWYTGSCGGTMIGTGASLSVSPSTSTTYYARGEGGCASGGTCASILVNVNSSPAQPATISGNATVCDGSANTYTITAVPGATDYTWTLPGGWSGTSTTNSISTTAGPNGGSISVTANNACGNSAAQSLTVTVNTTPAQPATISGNATVCDGSANTYTITAVPGATDYTWTLPGGWSGTSTTNSISTTAGPNGGNISVTANNACGNSAAQSLTVTVNTTPAQPATISGNATVCDGSANTYTITAVPGATDYTWTLPGGWSGTSTTNSISTTAGPNGGNISVTANNACGNSAAQSLTVTVNTTPAQPATISGNATVCDGSANTYTITAVPGATDYTWTLPGGWSGTSTTNSISTTAGSNGGSISVTANNACGNSAAQSLTVTVSPDPIAAFSFSTNLLAASFTDQSSFASGWSWDFGDGGTSTLQNPNHTYGVAGNYNVCLISTAGGCADTICHLVTVVAVGKEDGLGLKVSVYPNPSNGKFRVLSSEPLTGQFTDVHGRLIGCNNIDAGNDWLDLEPYADGVYFLWLSNGDSRICLRLVKMGE